METKILPIDIISTLILPKLPSKTLCRFKCVSKYFLIFISSSEFINLHSLSYFPSNEEIEKNRTLFVSGIDSTLYSFNLNSLQSTPVQFPLSGLFTPVPDATIEVIGSCNGLLCLASICTLKPKGYHVETVNQVVLLNPFTRSFKTIPFHRLHGKIRSLGLGFGFDDVNNDYNLVSVIKFEQDIWFQFVVVHSFNSNTWKFINHEIQSYVIEDKGWSVLINNHLLHWLSMIPDLRIVCFDVRTNKWIEDVPLPQRCIDRNRHACSLFISLCIRKSEIGDFRCLEIDLWIMKEYGVKESWLLHRASIKSFPRNYFGLFVSIRKDEIILKERSESNLMYVYNIEDSLVTQKELHGIAPFYQAYECHESLANIP